MDINAILREGMTAISRLLDERAGTPNPVAALALAKALQSLHPNPRILANAADDLKQFRHKHPDVVDAFLPETFKWVDRQ